MDAETMTALIANNGLSDGARVLAIHLHARGPEPQEYKAEDLSALLHNYPNAQTVWRHIRQLEVAGFVECVKAVPGPGHGKTLRPLPLKKVTGSESNPVNISGVSASTHENNQGLAGASSSSTDTTPPPTAREDVDDLHLEKLRRLLAPHDDVLDRFGESAKHAPTWARDIWCCYRPPTGASGDGGGTEWAAVFAGEDQETAVRVLVNALRDYAEKNERYSGFLFRKFVRTALKEVRDAATAMLAGTGTDGGRRIPKRDQPADTQTYSPTPYRGLNS